mmetsp:Transcript_3308/g.10324  ORF Transcript_3308/g.10324 Transcript_3308/m.10324 type:complete len:264 (-) Transcript_3308:62-853(-)
MFPFVRLSRHRCRRAQPQPLVHDHERGRLQAERERRAGRQRPAFGGAHGCVLVRLHAEQGHSEPEEESHRRRETHLPEGAQGGADQRVLAHAGAPQQEEHASGGARALLCGAARRAAGDSRECVLVVGVRPARRSGPVRREEHRARALHLRAEQRAGALRGGSHAAQPAEHEQLRGGHSLHRHLGLHVAERAAGAAGRAGPRAGEPAHQPLLWPADQGGEPARRRCAQVRRRCAHLPVRRRARRARATAAGGARAAVRHRDPD